MRRYLLLILFVLILLAPFVVRWAIGSGQVVEALPAGARRLVVITPHNQDIRREFGRAFSAWHQKTYGEPAAIEYLNPGGANDVVRQLDAFYASYRDADQKLVPEEQVPADIHVVWGGGDTIFERDLKRRGILRPIGLSRAAIEEAFPQSTLGGVKLHDGAVSSDGTWTPPRWVGVCLSSFGIIYNPELYAALGLPAPQTWKDLGDPRLNRLIALADPTHSGSAAITYMMVVQRAMADAEEAVLAAHPDLQAMDAKARAADPRYQSAIADGWHTGMGTLLLMAANTRYFTDSASQVPNDVGHGEAAAGVAIDFYARVAAETVGEHRLTYVAPAAATAITPDPVAILYGVKGDDLQLAERFVEFLLSEEGQRLWILKPGTPGGPFERGLRRPPIRQSVYADTTGWSDAQNPFAESGGFNQRSDWMSLYSDTRPVWAAAWIDAREDLRRVYDAVLAVKDEARRDALLKQLADLPITMDQVQAMYDTRRQLEKDGGDVGQWRARSRIDLARRFREHYDAVATEASR